MEESNDAAGPETSARSYLLQADGSGTGTVSAPSRAAIGVVLKDPEGHLLESLSQPIGRATNSEAEYRALIEGLRLAKRHAIERIRVFLDSELVVDQVSGLAEVKADHLKPLHAEAVALFNGFRNKRIAWVPRKWNKEADALATQALSADDPPN